MDIDFSKLPSLEGLPVSSIADALALKKIAGKVAQGPIDYAAYCEMCSMVGASPASQTDYLSQPQTHLASMVTVITPQVGGKNATTAISETKALLQKGVTDPKEVCAKVLDALHAPKEYARLVRSI